MPRSLLVTGFANTYTNSGLVYNPPGGARHGATSEPQTEFWTTVAGSFDRPGATFTTTVGTTRKAGIRKNGAAGTTHTFTDGTSGVLVDSTGAAAPLSVTTGDRFSLSLEAASGSYSYTGQWAAFAASGGTATLLLSSSAGGVAAGGFNADTRAFAVAGSPGLYTAANANARTKVRVAGTAQGGFLHVLSNARATDSVATLYVNGAATSIVVTVPAGQTGVFRDTTHTASISAGDDLHWLVANGAGASEALVIQQFGVAILASGVASDVVTRSGVGVARTGSATPNYAAVGGQLILTGTSETQRAIKTGFPFRASRLRMLTGTAGYDTTVTLRKNGVATALTVTQASGDSGAEEDTTHTVDFDGTEEVTYEISGGTSGSTTIHFIALLIEDVSGSVGLAAGTSTVTAVAAPEGIGTAAGTSTAVAVGEGADPNAAVGTAAGSSTAQAIAGTARGTASGTSDAIGISPSTGKKRRTVHLIG